MRSAKQKTPEQEQAESDLESLLQFREEMESIEVNPFPRGGKRVGGEVWFDLELKPPMGLRLDTAPGNNIVGVSEVLEGGSAWEHNLKNTWTPPDEQSEDDQAQGFGSSAGLQNFIQPGDRIVLVNGEKVRTQEEVVAVIQKAEEGKPVRLKLARNNRGPITVVFPEPAKRVVVKPSTRLLAAAYMAGHDISGVDECEDRCSGNCWHLDERSGEVYQMCVEGCIVSEIPSNSGVQNLGKQIAALAKVAAGGETITTTFDNTEPLVLRPCPEVFERLNDPFVGKWMYGAGTYSIVRNGDVRRYKENGEMGSFDAVLREEDDWLVADLDPHGSIRLRPGESAGLSVDMDSQFRPAGSNEWGPTNTAFKV